jgi:DNA-binding transcriptional LysR family regulator
MDRLEELEILVAILHYGSLAETARRTRRSAPAITRAIASLEQRFGARLLERTTRRMAPTEAGTRLAERAQLVLGYYNEAVEDTVETRLSGLLSITAPVPFGRKFVTPLALEFLQLHAGIQIEMLLNDRNLNLIDEGLDLAVRIGHLADSTMVARKVGDVSRILVASPAYLARCGEPLRPEDLSSHQAIIGAMNSPYGEWRFGLHEEEKRIKLSSRLIFNDVESQLLAVRAGYGIARLLSYQAAEDLASGVMIRLLPNFEPLPLPVQLVVQNARRMPGKVRAFWDFAWQRLSNLPLFTSAPET